MKLRPKQVLVLCIATVGITLAVEIGYTQTWTGFSGKSLWDWLDLLIVPTLVLAVGIYIDLRQRQYERELERKLDAQRERRERIRSLQERVVAKRGKNIEDEVSKMQSEKGK